MTARATVAVTEESQATDTSSLIRDRVAPSFPDCPDFTMHCTITEVQPPQPQLTAESTREGLETVIAGYLLQRCREPHESAGGASSRR